MKPIEGWENVKENTGFQRLAPGGYFIKILNVENVEPKQYLKIAFDIADGPNKGYFAKQYAEDTHEKDKKKWPNAGTFVRSYKDSAKSMFKGFTNAIEGSNKNYQWEWDEQSLVGKYVGVVIGDEEYLNQKGQLRTRNYVAAVRSIDTIKKGEFKVPEIKKLDTTKTTTPTPAPFNDPFNNAANDDTPPFEADAPAAESTPDPFGDFNPFA